eukprot:6860662-Lingulodinium_polyedra.AAC.1
MECARRAIRERLRRRAAFAIASLCSVLQTLHNDAVAIAVRRGSGAARELHVSHAPCKRQEL